jgi:glycosyltransferase involved in cell wall biosynthesis
MNVLSTGDYSVSLTISIAQFELLIGLKKKGVNMVVVAKFSDEISDKLKAAGIICINDYPNSKVDFEYIIRMKQYVVDHKIDIIHAFDGKALRNTIIAVKKLPVKLITYMGSTSIHWHDPSAYFTYLSPRVDKIICNSEYVYQHVKKQFFWRNKKKAVRIFKGYNANWFDTITPFNFKSLHIKASTTIVCLAANYLKVKGIEYFIEATNYVTKDTDICFVLIGDMRGNKDTINTLIENSPLKDKIYALGFKSDPVSFFKSIDIYVQTSNREGFGRAISEAMCSGKPIIMTNAGGCTELIDEKSGIVVPTKNPKAIAEAIIKLTENKELRKAMGKSALNRINNNFHIDKTIQETLKLYNSLSKEV